MKTFLIFLALFFLQFGDVAGVCDLIDYKGSAFQPNSARVHTKFLSAIQNINSYARECHVKIYVTSSYRSTHRVGGAIVTPARRSNHMVGHAIDMNLVDRKTARFCNSRCLAVKRGRPDGVTCFINKIRSDVVLRWGGDFTNPDPVHIDDATNIRKPVLWKQLYHLLQNNC